MRGVGIVGAGHFGANHARALAAIDRVHITAACRNDDAGLRAFVAEFGGTPYLNWRDLLADPAVDIVLVATPHHLHREITVAALGMGRHVLLEKPMAATPAECDRIAAAAARSSASLMVGHVSRYFPAIQTAARILASGEIGRPVSGSSAFVKLWMEANRQPWHLDPDAGGGMLMTAGIHALDRLVFLMGGSVAAVGAMTGTFFHPQQADDLALINLRFTDGRIGQVTSIGYADGAVRNDLELVCQAGVLTLSLSGEVRIGQAGQWRSVPVAHHDQPLHEALRRQWQAFLSAIDMGAPPPVDANYASHLVAIVAAAFRSNTERREIEL
jgi:phthalate 4,5-cis-dihydrodiol dehydrogenase